MAQTMRGMRLGSQSLETEAGVNLSPRQKATFRCPADHEFDLVFALEVELPLSWECKQCAETALRLEDGLEVDQAVNDKDGPRTHFDMVLERRSRDELEELLQEVLADMRQRRASGRLTA
jgi:hypothetical protein